MRRGVEARRLPGERWSVRDAAVIGALHPHILSNPVSAWASRPGLPASETAPHSLSRLGDGGSIIPDSDGSTRPAAFEGERLRLEESMQVPGRAWAGAVRRCWRKSVMAWPSVCRSRSSRWSKKCVMVVGASLGLGSWLVRVPGTWRCL